MQITAIDDKDQRIALFGLLQTLIILRRQYFSSIFQLTGGPNNIIGGYGYGHREMTEVIIKFLCAGIRDGVPSINIIIYCNAWKEIGDKSSPGFDFARSYMRSFVQCIMIPDPKLDFLSRVSLLAFRWALVAIDDQP